MVRFRNFLSAPLRTSLRSFHNRPGRKVLPQRIRAELLAKVHLRLGLVGSMRLESDHIEAQMIECRAHGVELVLSLHNQLIVVVQVRPLFLLFRERSVLSRSPPFPAGSADPAVKNLASGEFHRVSKTSHKVCELE